MKTKYTLFTEVNSFYTNLTAALTEAQHSISMIYFTFDHGQWSGKISRILRAKAANGVKVCLMVDELGLLVDNPNNAFRNRGLMRELEAAGGFKSTFSDLRDATLANLTGCTAKYARLTKRWPLWEVPTLATITRICGIQICAWMETSATLSIACTIILVSFRVETEHDKTASQISCACRICRRSRIPLFG